MAVFKWEDIVSSHNYISPVFTDLFTEEERMVTHVVQDFNFFIAITFFYTKDMWTTCFLYLLELQAMTCNLNYSWNMQFGWWNVRHFWKILLHIGLKGHFDTDTLPFHLLMCFAKLYEKVLAFRFAAWFVGNLWFWHDFLIKPRSNITYKGVIIFCFRRNS